MHNTSELLQARDNCHVCDGMGVTHLEQTYTKRFDKGIACLFLHVGKKGGSDVIHGDSFMHTGVSSRRLPPAGIRLLMASLPGAVTEIATVGLQQYTVTVAA
jgi:hypothetical protein